MSIQDRVRIFDERFLYLQRIIKVPSRGWTRSMWTCGPPGLSENGVPEIPWDKPMFNHGKRLLIGHFDGPSNF